MRRRRAPMPPKDGRHDSVTLWTRFWAKVGLGAGGCWTWSGATPSTGYNRIWRGRVDGRRFQVQAHKLAYELLVGPVPDGLVLDHLCRNRGCVNPAHLEPVTHRENIMRGEGPARVNAEKSSCLNGHPLDGDNLWMRYGKRTCRACFRKRDRESHKRCRDRGMVYAPASNLSNQDLQ